MNISTTSNVRMKSRVWVSCRICFCAAPSRHWSWCRCSGTPRRQSDLAGAACTTRGSLRADVSRTSSPRSRRHRLLANKTDLLVYNTYPSSHDENSWDMHWKLVCFIANNSILFNCGRSNFSRHLIQFPVYARKCALLCRNERFFVGKQRNRQIVWACIQAKQWTERKERR